MAALPSNYLLNAALDAPQLMTASTATGIPVFGANCPAGILTSPYTWFKVLAPDGTPCWVPGWKQ